jgi:hypothetical protein
MSETAEHQLVEARAEIRQVCEWLLRPSAETLEACAPSLERAVAQIEKLCVCAHPGLLRDLRSLSGEIQTAQILLEAASRLYCGRLRRLISDHQDSQPSPEPISVMG